MLPYLFVVCIFFAAGFTQGVTGFGSALVAMPLLLLFLGAKTAVPLCVLNGLIITGFLSIQLKIHLEWRKILPLVLGCLPGIVVGIVVLKNANDDLIRLLLGVMLLGYVSYSFWVKPKERNLHLVWAYMAGFATGCIGSAFSAGGPPTIIYTTLTGWNKDAIKATLSGFFFVTAICIATAHALSGFTSVAVLQYFCASGLSVLLGVWAGSKLYARFSRETYLRAVWLLLTIMSFMLIGQALV